MKLALALAAVLLTSCSKTPAPASAVQTTSRAELIGGKRALGEVGDFKLSNGIIHAVIQDVGFSRGFGAFGGSLIDIDLVRAGRSSSTQGPVGNDYFTEMFPAFFLQAVEPSKVEVAADGKDGTPAIIRVTGEGGDFLSLVNSINDLLIPPVKTQYSVDYILEPGKQYLKIVVTLTNVDTREAQFPLAIPFGFITLLGEGQRLFVPGEGGFDLRFFLEDVVYKRDSKLEALPGAVSSMWATEGSGVSYAVAASPRGAGYMSSNPSFYEGAKPDSLFIPVAYSSFLGSFWAKPPPTIAPTKSFSYTAYLSVGTGDVASAQKVIYEIADEGGRQPTKTGTISGRVTEAGTGARLGGVSIVLQDEQGNYLTQVRTIDGSGHFTAQVPKGAKYRAIASDAIRPATTSDGYVDIPVEGAMGEINLTMPRPAALEVTVRDDKGRLLPAKISIEGTYAQTGSEPPRKFLYDLKVGSRYRVSDLVPDTDDAESRRFLERVLFAPGGSAGTAIKPGHYKVYASRGIEYSLASQEIELVAGKTGRLELVLSHVMDTPGWASADFHVHSVNSVDSDMSLTDRVASFAVEGVDLVTSTDHNFVTDFEPTLEALDLKDWLHSTIGLELTTLEMGHFNAFPVKVDPGPVTHGSFRWFRRPPGELFAQLRGLGKTATSTIVQVNHPRDSVLGYFNAFNVGTYTGAPLPPSSAFVLDQSPLPDGGTSPYHPSNFSLDFDVIEVFNGKHDEQLFSYRVPATATGPEPTLPACSGGKVADCIPSVGEIIHLAVNTADAGQPKNFVLQPAFPGAMEDWFTLLGQGHHFTATGNSDSHNAIAEAGLPRTYLNVGETANGSMRGLSEEAMMKALRNGNAVVTNGPFIEATINGKGLGEEVVAPDGEIRLTLTVKAAPWVDVAQIVIRRGGRNQGQSPIVLETIPVPQSTALIRFSQTLTYKNVPDDSFVVIEVSGKKSMWPVFTPREFASIQISDAVGVIGGAFGFGNKYGKYRPNPVDEVRPFAFTNPIWVNHSKKQPLTRAKPVLPVSNSEPFSPRTIKDVRKIFANFHSDPE
jgi:hypothetical protein